MDSARMAIDWLIGLFPKNSAAPQETAQPKNITITVRFNDEIEKIELNMPNTATVRDIKQKIKEIKKNKDPFRLCQNVDLGNLETLAKTEKLSKLSFSGSRLELVGIYNAKEQSE